MSSKRLLLFIIFTVITAVRADAIAPYFDYNERCRNAYNAYLSLDIAEGDRQIITELNAHPDNMMAVYIADYGDFLTLLFRGSKNEYKNRLPKFTERIELLEKTQDNSPWKKVAIAGVNLHLAVVHGWYGEQFKAATTFRKAFLQLKDNKNKFPAFEQNNVFLAVGEAIAGAVPEEQKWIAALFGIKGDVRNAYARLVQYTANKQSGTIFYDEAIIYQLYIRFYLLSQKNEVWAQINKGEVLNDANNLLFAFVKSNIALNSNHAEEAYTILKQASVLPQYHTIPVMEFEMGNALLYNNDVTAIHHFNKYVATNKAQVYTKDALMKIALCYYLQQNMVNAQTVRDRITKYGNAITDADKQAMRFAKEEAWPLRSLLQARLLTDGGEYKKAIAILNTITPPSNITDLLEYNYRLAKCYDETEADDKAIKLYKVTMQQGADRKEQFAARSCLQLGLLYEKQGKRDIALQYFNQCLTMRDHDFQQSIDQQAKAGINRLSK